MNKIDAKKKRQDAFISEFLINGRNSTLACKTIGIGRTTLCAWRKDDEFNKKLEEKEKAINAASEDIYKRMHENALKCVTNLSGVDPETALEVLAMLDPEKWDKSIRKLKYERERGVAEQKRSITVTITPGERPARIKTGTDE